MAAMTKSDPLLGRAAPWLLALALVCGGCAAQEQAAGPAPASPAATAQAAVKPEAPATPTKTEASPPPQVDAMDAVTSGGDPYEQFAAEDDETPGADFFSDDDEPPQLRVEVYDPLEPINRVMFDFNDGVYRHVLDPVGRGYKAALPPDIRKVISNFFHNLATPVRFVAAVLQGDFDTAGIEAYRFATNTTIGILGFADAAEDLLDLPAPSDEDLGQTMGVWGVDHGFYIVWPLLGPSSLRDSVGMVTTWQIDPVSSYLDFWETVGLTGEEYLNEYSFHVGDYQSLVDGAIDPYVAMRDFYVKYRHRRVQE
jgi:phospholipid-binding lipoprotein MlaA